MTKININLNTKFVIFSIKTDLHIVNVTYDVTTVIKEKLKKIEGKILKNLDTKKR